MQDVKIHPLFRGGDEDKLATLRARLLLHVTELISSQMHSQGVSRSVLARRLGKSPGNISDMLSGRQNLTLRVIAELLAALDCELTVSVQSVRVEDQECITWQLTGEPELPFEYPNQPSCEKGNSTEVSALAGAA